MNLSKYQKHNNFHILKFADHIEELPTHFYIRSENFFELTVAENHDVAIEVDGRTFKSENGHIFFLSPGQSIQIDVKEFKEGTLGYMLYFTVDFLNFSPTTFSFIKRFPYFNMHQSPFYYMAQNHNQFFLEYMEKIYMEFQKLDEDNIEIIRSYLTIMLFEAKRLLLNDTMKSSINSRAEEITFQFENLLKKTEHKRQKLAYYSSQLNISSIYLSECVKKVTGQPAKKVISEYIIFEAKSLLSQSSNTIEKITFQLGFDDVSNFMNFFKKNTDLTPNQFRKQLKYAD